LYVAGQMDDESIIAAIGLGNIIQNVMIEPIFVSLNAGMEILVSQAVGAKNYRLCGIYLNRGTLAIFIVFLFMIIMLLKSKQILIDF
jgi:Na+-driven multidrug efflux pump